MVRLGWWNTFNGKNNQLNLYFILSPGKRICRVTLSSCMQRSKRAVTPLRQVDALALCRELAQHGPGPGFCSEVCQVLRACRQITLAQRVWFSPSVGGSDA